jgi:hypothetical protein
MTPSERAQVKRLQGRVRNLEGENDRLRERARHRVLMEELDDTTPDDAVLVAGEPTRLVWILRSLAAHVGLSWVVEGRA